MLGILLIYYIGKQFYVLAAEHQKSQWLYAILGVLTYYLGAFICGIFLTILSEFKLVRPIEEIPDIALSFIALPIGILSCVGFYILLKKYWEKRTTYNALYDKTLDGEFTKRTNF